jgi:hypothetical protein
MTRDFLGSIWYVQPSDHGWLFARVIQAVVLGLFINSLEDENDGYICGCVPSSCRGVSHPSLSIINVSFT